MRSGRLVTEEKTSSLFGLRFWFTIVWFTMVLVCYGFALLWFWFTMFIGLLCFWFVIFIDLLSLLVYYAVMPIGLLCSLGLVRSWKYWSKEQVHVETVKI